MAADQFIKLLPIDKPGLFKQLPSSFMPTTTAGLKNESVQVLRRDHADGHAVVVERSR